jgi:CarboxypepD_reg-like domain
MKYHFTNYYRFSANMLSTICLICCVLTTFAQSRMITGKVVSPDGKPLQSVNVMVRGATTGTVTDADGAYKISVPDSQNAGLSFSSVGYRTTTKTVGAFSEINLTLYEDVSELSQVVVTATTQPVRKLETVTAVEVIDAKQIARASSVNIADAIKFVPGVFVHTDFPQRCYLISHKSRPKMN